MVMAGRCVDACRHTIVRWRIKEKTLVFDLGLFLLSLTHKKVKYMVWLHSSSIRRIFFLLTIQITSLMMKKRQTPLQNSITMISNDYCQNYFLFERKWTIGILIVTTITVVEYQSECLMNFGLVNIFEQ